VRFKRNLILVIALGMTVNTQTIATNGNQATATGQSARGAAGAGIAYPQDTLAVGINPAAGVHIGDRIDTGLELFKPKREFTYAGSTSDGNDTDVFIVPEFGYNRMLTRNISGNDKAFSLAIYGAGGQNTDYANHAIIRNAKLRFGIPLTNGQSPAMVNLEQLFVQPTFSTELGKRHSVGISAILAYQTLEVEGLEPFDNPTFSSSPGNVTNNGKDDAFGIGFSFGWIGKVNNRLTLGAMYQTRIKMDSFDKYKGIITDGGTLDIPAKTGIGLAFAASPKWDILFDINRVFYSDTKALGNSTIAPPETPASLGATTGFGWDDQTVYKFGVVYKHSSKLTLRAGLNYGKNPVPNSTFNDGFFNSLTQAITEKHLSLGFTYRIKPKMSITGSYVRTFEKTLTGNGTSLIGLGDAPDLRVNQHALGLTFSWHL